MDFALLAELCAAPGAPGREEAIGRLVRRELTAAADEVLDDPLGTVVGMRRGEDGPRLMLAAHMDEIAFMVTHVADGGFLRVLPLGGFDPKTLVAQRVVVHGREDLLGVMGTKPIHLMSDADKRKVAAIEDVVVDTGLPEERVREAVRPGDVVTREARLERLGDLITGKSLDNRAGLYVMVEAFRRLSAHRCRVYAAATAQEEVGARGARVATSRVAPELGLAIDTTFANDLPEAKAHQRCTTLGGGAAIKVFDRSAIVPARVVDHLVTVATEREIPYQIEVMSRGGTDTRELQISGRGAVAGAVSIPTRYLHQSVEVCHPDDLDACVRLVVAFCETAHTLLEDAA